MKVLRTKALRKIFRTTLSIFILVVVLAVSTTKELSVLKTNKELDEVAKLETSNIYLLSDEGFLVRDKVVIDSSDTKDAVKKIINSLIDTNKKKGLRGVIPAKTKLKEVIVGKDIVTLDFSKEILKVKLEDEKNMISSIVYSVLELDGIKGVSILVEGEVLDKYPNSQEEIPSICDKSIGINKIYDITSRENISKVVVYYLDKIEDNTYYVPVTKYVNDDREKIKIIVEELASSYIYESNLMSFLNSNTELLDYSESDGVMILNFNDYIMDGNDKLIEEVIYCLSLSIFDNYEADMVMFQVNSEVVGHMRREDVV